MLGLGLDPALRPESTGLSLGHGIESTGLGLVGPGLGLDGPGLGLKVQALYLIGLEGPGFVLGL